MKHSRYFTFLVATSIALVTLFSCNVNKKDDADNTLQELPPSPPATVTTVPLAMVDFEHELVSNGRISARMVADAKFQSTEVITQIFVKNGDRVTKGQRIAQLDTFVLNNRMQQARNTLERSRLDMQEVLITRGYTLDNLHTATDEDVQLAKTRSGFNTAQITYNAALHDLNQATLTAPISGTVANLFTKPLSLSRPGDVFCNIIDTQNLEVSFTVLEHELGYIQVGNNVRVIPFSIPSLSVEGRISEINPWVNENGMVNVKASVAFNPRLVEGMNVRISAFRSVGQHWVVPKTAVVLRTGRQVVFTALNGRARWHYVETGLENATEYTIINPENTLREGDQIIISGNINLANESPILIEN